MSTPTKYDELKAEDVWINKAFKLLSSNSAADLSRQDLLSFLRYCKILQEDAQALNDKLQKELQFSKEALNNKLPKDLQFSKLTYKIF